MLILLSLKSFQQLKFLQNDAVVFLSCYFPTHSDAFALCSKYPRWISDKYIRYASHASDYHQFQIYLGINFLVSRFEGYILLFFNSSQFALVLNSQLEVIGTHLSCFSKLLYHLLLKGIWCVEQSPPKNIKKILLL